MRNSYTKKQKLWNSSYIFMMIMSTVTSLAFNMISPVITKYALSIGVELGFAGVIAGMFSLTALVARPVSGILCDRAKKKMVLVASTLLCAVSILGYIVAKNAVMLLLFRVLHGFGFSMSSTSSMALSTQYIPEERMGEGIGYMGLSSIIATMFAPGIGVAIIEGSGGFTLCYIIAAAFPLITGLTLLFAKLPEQYQKKENKKINLHDFFAKEVIIYSLVNGVFSLGNGIINSFLLLTAEQRGIEGVGLFFTVTSIALLVIRPITGRLADSVDNKLVITPAYISAACAMFLLAGANGLWMIIAAGVLKAIGQGTGQPALQVICIKKLPAERRGVAISTYYMGADIGQGIGPMIGGAVSGAAGYGTMYAGCGVLMLMTMGVFLWHYQKDQKRELQKING